jgi:hypothetical protein
MTDAELMRKIHGELGSTFFRLAESSSVPRAFLAALVAGESGGRDDATRFEPGVFAKILLAAGGHKSFSDPSLSRPLEQKEWLAQADKGLGSRPPGTSYFFAGLQEIEELATSYGYTQLMGWHALEWHAPVADFLNPALHFHYTLRLLAFFTEKYQLDLAADYQAALLRCWNTGRPDGKTFDPQYVENGLRRMTLYDQIEKGELR